MLLLLIMDSLVTEDDVKAAPVLSNVMIPVCSKKAMDDLMSQSLQTQRSAMHEKRTKARKAKKLANTAIEALCQLQNEHKQASAKDHRQTRASPNIDLPSSAYRLLQGVQRQLHDTSVSKNKDCMMLGS